MLLVAVLYLICASTFIISKAALGVAEPIFYTGIRMMVAGMLMLAYHWWKNGKKLGIKPAHYPLFLGGILIYIYGSYVPDNIALKYVSCGKACFFYNLSPFISALFSYWFFAEVMTPKKWLGMLIGFAGFTPMLMTCSDGGGLFRGWPELLLLIAVICSVWGWIIVRQLVKLHGYSTWVVNGVSMTGGGLLALGNSFFVESWEPVPVSNVASFLWYTVLIMIVSNLIFSNLYTILLKQYTATFLSFAGFTAPLFAAGLGWVFFSETASWDIIPSTVLVLCGLYIFYREELRQGYLVQSS
jgi:drug/metabolite transporter (DMT)-like permease